MQVPAAIRKCVAFLAYNGTDGLKFAGTAFFVSIDPKEFGVIFIYLVTAKHVIVQIKKHSVDGNVLIRLNDTTGSFKFVVSAAANWVLHPDDTSIDVSVLPWAPDPSQFDFLVYPYEQFLTDAIIKDQDVGVGDEVFMTGLFASHYG